ncbi:MAG: hypothetical protein ACQEQW_01970 [Bacteroidota bacterium]
MRDRDELSEGVMKRISCRKSGMDYVFGWTEIVWLRRSMTVASVLIVILFAVQQLFITKRIEKLEKRMISINTDKVLEYQRENVIANSVLFTGPDRKDMNDSIKVATGDLLDLVKSYRSLQAKYEEILNKARADKLENKKQKL